LKRAYETEGKQLIADFEKTSPYRLLMKLGKTLTQNGRIETISST
jgi:hypothetical protein